jgi:hypothetical protein
MALILREEDRNCSQHVIAAMLMEQRHSISQSQAVCQHIAASLRRKGDGLFDLELRNEKAEGRISRLQPTPHLPPASAGGPVEYRDKQPASAGLVIGLQTEWPVTSRFSLRSVF